MLAAAIQRYHDLLTPQIAADSQAHLEQQTQSRGMHFGDRPVCVPVRTTSGPSAASVPSASRMARSYSSAVERFASTLPPMVDVGAGLVIVTDRYLDWRAGVTARVGSVTGRA